MPTIDEQKDVSSAEITAVYRCEIPKLSGDTLSEKLASSAGRERAQAFITKYDYPLVNRKISARAGYFLSQATSLLASGEYDACISFASGFSLLIYYIASQNSAHKKIKYFDTDFSHMIVERQKRISNIHDLLDASILKKIQSKTLDIENAYQNNLSLKDLFPDCHRPIFICEGISYFLTSGCVDWLFEQIGSYDHSAVIVDYWPEDMPKISSLFARVFSDLNKGMILEPLKSFWDESTIEKFKSQFSEISDYSIAEVDEVLSREQSLEPELIDPNEYFPLRIIVGKK